MKNKSLKSLIIIIIVIFIACYYVSNSGYYEYTIQKKTIITNERIKEFEQDVKNGNEVDIKDYLDNEDKDYSNKFTDIIYKLSNNGNKLARKCITAIFKKLSYLVED